MLTVYLAGPEVFLPDAMDIGRKKKALCARYGFAGLYPLDGEVSAGEGREDELIYRANRALMQRADLGICNLTPFRGAGADGGTAFELGYMAALGKRVFAYTNEASDYAARVVARADSPPGPRRDHLDLMIEDFGNFDNLMLECAVRESSGHSVVRHAAQVHDLYRDLTAFEHCLRLAAQSAR